ncbi:MAG: hypothetical protein HOA90_17520, partial [Prolixibacteraceae bacterium]|nr:hypothetical protein [Prolixibacteraceae bacterium]
MFLKFNKYSYLVLAICFFVAAAIIENYLLKEHPENHLIEEIQEKLIANEKELLFHLEKIAELISSNDFDGDFNSYLNENNLLLEENGTGFLVFKSGDLQYWSDRSISFFHTIGEMGDANGLIQLPNGYYLAHTFTKNEFDIVGLLLIKNSYQYENKYLKNSYFKNLKIPDEFELSDLKLDSAYPIINTDGDFLFSIIPGGLYLCTTKQLYMPGIIYLLGLLVLLLYFRREFVESGAAFFLKLFSLGTALFIVYWLHLIFQVPKVFFHLRFFSPEFFALSNWLPSLGDFFLLTLFFFFWLYNFGVDVNIQKLHEDSKLNRKTIAGLLLLFSASLFLFTNFFIEQLIYNSTISFSLNKIIEISVQSALGIFSVGLFLFANLFFNIKIIEKSRNDLKLIELAGLILVIVIFLMGTQFISIGRITLIPLSFFIVATILASLLSKNYLHKFTLSYLIIFVSVASVYSLAVFYQTTSAKEREIQKLMAVTLLADNDPAAEVFLAEIQQRIIVDSTIPNLLIEEEGLKEYLIQTYYSSY